MSTFPTVTVRAIGDLEALEAVGSYWEGCQDHPNNDFAHFKLVCALRPEIECPYVIVVERCGEPCALLAARLERTRLAPSVGYFKLVWIPAKVLTVIYRGLLGDVDVAIGSAIVQHLLSMLTSRQADLVVLHHLSEDSPLLETLQSDGVRRLCERRPSWSLHWEMTLLEEPGFMQHKVRSKHRYWIRRKQRELEAAFPGRISWRWMSSFGDMSDLCERMETVAALTYQRGLGVGFVNDEEHRKRFALFARRGQLRIQLLEIDGRVRAFWVGIVYRMVFYSSATAYDPDLRRFEAGTLIFARMVDELAREGVQKLDFGLGDALYKQRFGDRSWREATVRLFAPTWKGLALRSVLEIFSILDRTGRYVMQNIGQLIRLKTAWRRRMVPSNHLGKGH